MPTIEVEDAPSGTAKIEETQRAETEQIEGIEIKDGKVFVSLPRLVADMTPPDRVKVLDWYLREGEVVVGLEEQEEQMALLEFLGDGCLLAIPPLGRMRVVKIEAEVGKIIHLNAPLVVFERVQEAA
jgi:hypothetical protein